jgi:hypothetical protein
MRLMADIRQRRHVRGADHSQRHTAEARTAGQIAKGTDVKSVPFLRNEAECVREAKADLLQVFGDDEQDFDFGGQTVVLRRAELPFLQRCDYELGIREGLREDDG